MMTWQQIESAPKNGEHVLISDGILIFTAYLYRDGEWRDSWNGSVHGDTEFTPTHWMPLPEPPR